MKTKRDLLGRTAALAAARLLYLMLFAFVDEIEAQDISEERLAISSIEFLEAQGPSKDTELPEGSSTQIGSRSNFRVKFFLGDRNLTPKFIEPLKGQSRIGLFLYRDRGAIASVQRGSLENCTSGFCSAVFAGNQFFDFYKEELKEPSKWFVQALQNPKIEERLLEVEDPKPKDDRIQSITLSIRYGFTAFSLEETSSTLFNEAKTSQRLSWGREWSAQLWADQWFADYQSVFVGLGTKGFFEDKFTSSYKESTVRGGRGWALGRWFSAGLSAGYTQQEFATVNDDTAIIPTNYKGFLAGAFVTYKTPWEIYANPSKTFAFEVGKGRAMYERSVFGKADDSGEFKRGDKGSWALGRISYMHIMKTRASRWWLNGFEIGTEVALDLRSDSFTGDPQGPYGGLPSASETSGTQFFWKILVGREIRFR